jgi:hypothetical protein
MFIRTTSIVPNRKKIRRKPRLRQTMPGLQRIGSSDKIDRAAAKAGSLFMDESLFADNAAGISAAAILSLALALMVELSITPTVILALRPFWSFGVADITPPAMASESLPVASAWHQLKISGNLCNPRLHWHLLPFAAAPSIEAAPPAPIPPACAPAAANIKPTNKIERFFMIQTFLAV